MIFRSLPPRKDRNTDELRQASLRSQSRRVPKETHGMTTNTNLNTILNAFSDLIAAKSSERLAASVREDGKVRPRLFTVEDAALYLGRTKKAVQHMIASGKLPTVKADRRVFLDRKDLDEWIERGKSQ